MMFNKLQKFVAVIGLGAFAIAAPVAAQAQGGVNIGVLTCNKVPGGINLIIHSVTNIKCTFDTTNGSENYVGETGIGLGIDLEWSKTKVIKYSVISATSDVRMGSHSLAGKYVGGKASVTVGVGAGAQVLVGGGPNNLSLQPLALEGSTGFGAAAGIGYLSLEAAK